MIRSLRLQRLGPFTDLECADFRRLNIVVGINGAGKSTLRNALTLIYSGTADGHEGGKGLDELRTIGGPAGKKWQIDADILIGGKEVQFSRTDAEGPNSAKQSLVEAKTGVTGPRARACLDSGELLRLDRKERQRLLAALAPKATVVLSPAIKKGVADLLGENHVEIDVADIERLHKAAYEARREANATVRDLGDLPVPEVPEALGEIGDDPAAELTDIKAQIVKLRGERDAALALGSSQIVNVRPLEDAVTKARRSLDSIVAAVMALPTKDEIRARAQTLVDQMTEAGDANARNEEKRRDLQGQLATAKATMDHAKSAIAALNGEGSAPGCCPTCDTKLSAEKRKKLVAYLDNKYDAKGREWQEIKERLGIVPAHIDASKLEKEAQQLSMKEGELVRLDGEHKAAQAELGRAELALQEAKEKPGTPGDPAAADEAEKLAERIANGEAIRDALVSYVAAIATHKTAADRKADAMKRHAALDQLVADLGPTGIRKDCGNAGMFEFHEKLNAALAPRGFKVDLRPAMDAEGDPLVTVNGRVTPLPALSDGEKLAFGAAFACAVASVTGLGIVVVDRWEQLDVNASGIVFDILDASGHQVFVFKAQGEPDDVAEAKAREWNADGGDARMFLLRDGRLMAPGIERKGAAA